MDIVNFVDVSTYGLPELGHRIVAGPDQGLKQCEVWTQIIAPGAVAPVHCHDCEEVMTILAGHGTHEFTPMEVYSRS